MPRSPILITTLKLMKYSDINEQDITTKSRVDELNTGHIVLGHIDERYSYCKSKMKKVVAGVKERRKCA